MTEDVGHTALHKFSSEWFVNRLCNDDASTTEAVAHRGDWFVGRLFNKSVSSTETAAHTRLK